MKKPSDDMTESEANDLLRTTMIGHVVVTRGVATHPERVAVITAVRLFDDWSVGNDPYGEHDFGKVRVAGEDFFWTISTLEDGQKNLTIMLAEEY